MNRGDPRSTPEEVTWAKQMKTALERAGYRTRTWKMQSPIIEAVLEGKGDMLPAVLVKDNPNRVSPRAIRDITGPIYVFTTPYPEVGALMYRGEAISLAGYQGRPKELVTVMDREAIRLGSAYREAAMRRFTVTK